LPLFWRQQHEGSSPWLQYGPPSVPESRILLVLGVVAVGIALMATGSVLFGLLAAVAGLLWGAFDRKTVAEAQQRLGDWNASKICLACPRVFLL